MFTCTREEKTIKTTSKTILCSRILEKPTLSIHEPLILDTTQVSLLITPPEKSSKSSTLRDHYSEFKLF